MEEKKVGFVGTAKMTTEEMKAEIDNKKKDFTVFINRAMVPSNHYNGKLLTPDNVVVTRTEVNYAREGEIKTGVSYAVDCMLSEVGGDNPEQYEAAVTVDNTLKEIIDTSPDKEFGVRVDEEKSKTSNFRYNTYQSRKTTY